ncbi:MAG: hypothetical protein ABS46_00085 [Cytophagaceae bacterium SCN 52-12]|nr:MAG: hypothetical protein ABS46_00085 [Cytophagaceae bacterium SCN 52-12]
MKLFKNIICCLPLLAVVFLASCSKDADPVPDEIDGLKFVASLKNETHMVNLYSASGKLTTGYNEIFFQVRKADSSLVVNNISPEWAPTMKTENMSHSSPASAIAPVPGTSFLFSGFIIFPMAGDWELPITYHIDGTAYTSTGKAAVQAAQKRILESFEGSDGQKYVVTMLDPVKPVIDRNDMTALLYRMKSTNDFEPVSGYTIKIDPRMPAMGHDSPNNTDLTFKDGIYKGVVNLTMKGSWQINLQVANEKGEVIKGEPVTEANPASSIYFEIEL